MDEIEQIKNLVSGLEKKIRELEEENFALKNAIISACNSLAEQNVEMRGSVDFQELSQPNFKAPIWVKK